METFQGNHEDFSRPNGGDDRLVVAFYMGILQDEEASVEAGRAIFRDVEYCRKYVPGDQTLVIDQPATKLDRMRFAKQYERFKAGLNEDEQTVGTRLSDWPRLTRAQAEEYRYIGIKTVEQLAEVRDDIKHKIPGMQQVAREAAIWLGKTNSAAEAAKASKQIEDQSNKISALEQAVRDLIAKNERLEKASAKVAHA